MVNKISLDEMKKMFEGKNQIAIIIATKSIEYNGFYVFKMLDEKYYVTKGGI